MITRVVTNIIELLAKFVGETNERNLQERTGNNLTCSQPILGKWINDCDFPFIMEALALGDNVFKQEFPAIDLTHEERRMFAKQLDAHAGECARCAMKRAEDDAWHGWARGAFIEHRQKIVQVLVREAARP